MPTARSILDHRLAEAGFSLLVRGDSDATGYVSVLENNKEGYRVMRADHSLLGGVWLDGGGLVQEPIFGVFVMLEAVRLIQPTVALAESNYQDASPGSGKALFIGLGVGTAPAAFIHHGLNTTIVEIDALVYDFAVSHFALPQPHNAVIGDAVEWVSRAKTEAVGDYDFIVHDVFTGGVEPLVLFTVEFLSGLKDLLREDGAIAINYAGDFRLIPPQMVLRTILAVFPSCRIFRESEAPGESAGSDQTNVVVFCRKRKGTFGFKEPQEDDFLGTRTRQQWLRPKLEVSTNDFLPSCAQSETCQEEIARSNHDFLFNENIEQLAKWQVEAGKRHRELMRQLVPPAVWDNR